MILLLLLTQLAFADDYQVEVNPEVYSRKDFAAPGVKTGEIPARKPRPDALPDKRVRDAVFKSVPGLNEKIAGFDELDRDLLYVRAKTRSLAELKAQYPKIPAGKLIQLQKECRN